MFKIITLGTYTSFKAVIISKYVAIAIMNEVRKLCFGVSLSLCAVFGETNFVEKVELLTEIYDYANMLFSCLENWNDGLLGVFVIRS